MQYASQAFINACAAAGREPQWRLYVKWDSNGSTYVNETAYLVAASGRMRIAAPGDELVKPGDTSTATFTLSNDTRRFSWMNTNSPLYSYIGIDTGLIGKDIYLEVGFGDEYILVFTGHIEAWTEDSYNASIDIDCKDRGWKYLQRKVSTPILQNYRVDEYIRHLMTNLCDLTDESLILDVGLFRIPYAWCDDESVVEEIWEVARSEGGVAYFDSLGKLHFESMPHWAIHARGASCWTFTLDDFINNVPSYNADNVVTKVIVEWASRYITREAVVYTMEKPRIIGPGKTEEFEARFTLPAVVVYTPLYYRDYYTHGGGGQKIEVEITVPQVYGQRAMVKAVNKSATQSATLAYLQIRGLPLISGPDDQIIHDVSGTSGVLRPTPLPVDTVRDRSVRGNQYIQSALQAAALARMLGERYECIQRVWPIKDVPGVPQLELGDKLTVTDGNIASASITGFITAIDWRLGATVGYKQDIEVLDHATMLPPGATPGQPPTDYFIIGDTTYGKLGDHGRAWY